MSNSKKFKRTISIEIKKRLKQKIVFISGPRQCGKTTLSRDLTASFDYFNYDYPADRKTIMEMDWNRKKELLILDELHKMPNWKQFLKGIYDKEGIDPQLLVPGSAKLETFRNVGDSLAGRFFRFRLHPLDLKELKKMKYPKSEEACLDQLLAMGGFPEPFFKNSSDEYRLWKKSHHDTIIDIDLRDLSDIRHIQAVHTLIELLKDRVGSPISYQSLATDLQFSAHTVKQWLDMLEKLFVIFKVTPYSRKIARSILKEPKYYFYDTALILNEGAKFENLVACSLLKELHRIEDTLGHDVALHYVRTKEGAEVDFAVVIDQKVEGLIEAKWKEDSLSKSLHHFHKLLSPTHCVQVVRMPIREKTTASGIQIRQAASWLSRLKLRG